MNNVCYKKWNSNQLKAVDQLSGWKLMVSPIVNVSCGVKSMWQELGNALGSNWC